MDYSKYSRWSITWRPKRSKQYAHYALASLKGIISACADHGSQNLKAANAIIKTRMRLDK